MLQPFPEEVFIFSKQGSKQNNTQMMTGLRYTDDLKHLSSKRHWAARLQRPAVTFFAAGQHSTPWPVPPPCLRRAPDRSFILVPLTEGAWGSSDGISKHWWHATHPPTTSLPSTTPVTSYRNQHFLWHPNGSGAGLEQQNVPECCK